MSSGPLTKWVVLSLLAVVGVWFGWAVLLGRPDVTRAATWQTMAIPGPLSSGHAFLANNCAACHTSNKGVQAASCIVCHTDNTNVIQRQPTAFHATITACAACHLEHQGNIPRTAKMDHVALARIGIKQIQNAPAPHDQSRDVLAAWLKQNAPAAAPQFQREEALLNCATCHQTKDRHRGLFGSDCAQCHATAKWTLSEFRHPAPTSTSCVQCHQAPPSHYMEHFKMISMTAARQPEAQVSECFKCHQTTSWNDIKGVGWYKHH